MAFVKALRCRECGREYPIEPLNVCDFCFGPLEVAFDYDAIARVISRKRIAQGPLSMWRYQDLLPVDASEAVDLNAGFTPLIKARNLGRYLGLENLYIKNDSVNPSYSFKDRVVAVAATKALEFGFDTMACASTGNLACSVAAHAARARMKAVVFIPADLEAGKVLGRSKVSKHFKVRIEENHFSYERDQVKIDREAALDGVYVIRTSLPAERSSSQDTVRCYKSLAVVERAFRSLKSIDLKVRPIHHRLEGRVRAHVFLCMLAYYVEWHMRRALAPILFDDDDPEAAEAQRLSVVAPAQRSPKAQRKAMRKRTDDGLPVHSFRTLLADLGTIAKNQMRMGEQSFQMVTTATELQQRAFDLLQIPCR